MIVKIDSWESFWGSHEHDDELQGIEYRIPDKLLSLLEERGLEEGDVDEVIVNLFWDKVVYTNRGYRPFYNRTISRWDIEVSFDYTAQFNLGEWIPKLNDIEVVFEGQVLSRTETTINSEIIKFLEEFVFEKRKEIGTKRRVIDWLLRNAEVVSEGDYFAYSVEEAVEQLSYIDEQYDGSSIRDFGDCYETIAERIEKVLDGEIDLSIQTEKEFLKLLEEEKEKELDSLYN